VPRRLSASGAPALEDGADEHIASWLGTATVYVNEEATTAFLTIVGASKKEQIVRQMR